MADENNLYGFLYICLRKVFRLRSQPSAGMTNRGYQIQVHLNLVAFLALTTKIQEISDSL